MIFSDNGNRKTDDGGFNDIGGENVDLWYEDSGDVNGISVEGRQGGNVLVKVIVVVFYIKKILLCKVAFGGFCFIFQSSQWKEEILHVLYIITKIFSLWD